MWKPEDWTRECKTYRRGWDFFTPDCNTESAMNCLVCGELMDVQRGVEAPRRYLDAQFNLKVKHDRFQCRFSDMDWHYQAYLLRKEIKDCPSATITKLLEDELIKILTNRVSTKKLPDRPYDPIRD